MSKIWNLSQTSGKLWFLQEVDGHDIYALRRILTQTPFEANKPSAIICHTIKGKGIKGVEGDLTWHHKSKIKEEDISFLRKGLLD